MRTLILALSILISGCSGLVLRDTDTGLKTTGKVAARVVLAPVTLGMSELRMYELRLEEGCRSQGLPYNRMAHDCWYGAPQPLSIGDGLAAAALIQGMNQNLQSIRIPVTAPLPIQPAPVIQSTPQGMNCTTFANGPFLNTRCY